MSTVSTPPLPSTARLLRATIIALVVAAILLITAVLPAEFGIDPTGIGRHLGLDALATSDESAEVAPAPAKVEAPPNTQAAQAAEVFGASPGQTFDTDAVIQRQGPYRRDTMSLTLPPGKGAEIKASMKSGDAFVFHWTASNAVAVDMHGERTGSKDAFTSYWIERAQREGSGTFTAPFEGSHGWYWLNRTHEPITVEVEVSGFQQALFRPGHP